MSHPPYQLLPLHHPSVSQRGHIKQVQDQTLETSVRPHSRRERGTSPNWSEIQDGSYQPSRTFVWDYGCVFPRRTAIEEEMLMIILATVKMYR